MAANLEPATAEPVAWAITLNGKLRATLFVPEVAELTGLSQDRVRELIRSGRLPKLEVKENSQRTRYLIPVNGFLRFLAADQPTLHAS